MNQHQTRFARHLPSNTTPEPDELKSVSDLNPISHLPQDLGNIRENFSGLGPTFGQRNQCSKLSRIVRWMLLKTKIQLPQFSYTNTKLSTTPWPSPFLTHTHTKGAQDLQCTPTQISNLQSSTPDTARTSRLTAQNRKNC